MDKKYLVTIIGLCLLIFVVSLLPRGSSEPIRNERVVKIRDVIIPVEVVSKDKERSKGLSGREYLDQESGILFDFTREENAQPRFWMKDMKFGLDIIWISKYKVVQIDKNISAPNSGNDLRFYRSKQAIDYVLEVNSGFSDKNSLRVGDTVDLSGI